MIVVDDVEDDFDEVGDRRDHVREPGGEFQVGTRRELAERLGGLPRLLRDVLQDLLDLARGAVVVLSALDVNDQNVLDDALVDDRSVRAVDESLLIGRLERCG
ncbi:hypothetical protein AB0P12_32265 [Streptomyces subrutilus]|uniref:hypothetical protein n=1 Tax=Streptomyces subrutilus TaxID=36818 RepID=UPI00342081BE